MFAWLCSFVVFLFLFLKDYFFAFTRVLFPSLCWSFPPIIIHRAGFVESYCINLVFSWNILVSPSMLIESFVGYSRMGWHLCSLRICMTSPKELLVSSLC